MSLYFSIWDMECNLECSKPDCTTKEFVPKLITTSLDDHIILDLYISNQPDIHTELNPKLLLIDLIVYVLSTISFWFGFSVIMLSDVLSQVVIKLHTIYVNRDVFVLRDKYKASTILNQFVIAKKY